jgi:hypothetical protein
MMMLVKKRLETSAAAENQRGPDFKNCSGKVI